MMYYAKVFAFLLIMGWVFSGYSNININIGTHSFQFPSKIQTAFAAITASSTTYNTNGTFTYIVSTDACTQDIGLWGAGGGGADGTTSGGGGGGGGGAFASSTTAFEEDSSHTLVVGQGGAAGTSDGNGLDGTDTTVDATVIVADSGKGGTSPTTGGAGGLVAGTDSVGDVEFVGGTGADGVGGGDKGGGGGGAAGLEGAGGNGSGQTGGTGANGAGGAGGGIGLPGTSNVLGGGGGGGGANGGEGGNGGAPGGGGGGGEIPVTTGNGADGQIIVTEYIDDTGCAPPAIPALEQVAYRWFVNTDSTDVGSAAVMNQRIIAPRQGSPFRLRLLVHVYDDNLAINATQSALQISTTTDECDLGFSGETYNDVSSTSGYIQFFDNATPVEGAALTDNVKDPHHASSSSQGGEDTVINQNYAEGNNNFRNEQAAINETQDGLWDFALVDTGAPPGTRYCFRAVQEFGELYFSASGGYATGSIPELTTRQRVKIVLRGQVRLRIVRLR